MALRDFFINSYLNKTSDLHPAFSREMADVFAEEYFNRYRISLFTKGIGDIESLKNAPAFNDSYTRFEHNIVSDNEYLPQYTTTMMRALCQRWMEIEEEEPEKTN